MESQHIEQQLRAAQAEVELLRRRLAEADKEIEHLSYSISHDLRAPLRAIKGFSEALQEDYEGKLEEEGQRYLNIIINSTVQITRLIDGVLLLSRLGRQELRFSDINVDQLVREVVAELSSKAPQRNISVTIHPLPRCWGDPNLVRLVWANLLSNSFKFTGPRDQALIEVGGEARESDKCYFVKDNGVGFDMKYAEKLFGAFQRFHAEKEFEGVGMGLAVAQRLVRRHGGSIWADARLGHGAEFCFTLPGQR